MVTEPLLAEAAQNCKNGTKLKKLRKTVCFRQNAFILAKADENVGFGQNSLI